MDPEIRASLSDIRNDVRDGFINTNRRIDDLITRGEFQATIARVDSNHDTLRRDFEAHEQTTETLVHNLRQADIRAGQEAKAETAQLRKEVGTQLTEYRITTRWAIGIAVAGAGVLAGLVQWLLSI